MTHRGLLVDGLDDKLLVVERDIADLTPGEPNLWRELVVPLVDIQAKSIHPKPQFRSLLVLDAEVVDTIHLQVLSNLEVLQHGVLSVAGSGRVGREVEGGKEKMGRTEMRKEKRDEDKRKKDEDRHG